MAPGLRRGAGLLGVRSALERGPNAAPGRRREEAGEGKPGGLEEAEGRRKEGQAEQVRTPHRNVGTKTKHPSFRRHVPPG